MIEVLILEQVGHFTQDTPGRGEAQSLTHNVNVVLIEANQWLCKMLVE